MKQILNIKCNKDNKELLSIIENEILNKESNKILKQNEVQYIDINKITNGKSQELSIFFFQLNKNLKSLNAINDYFSEIFNSYLIYVKKFLSDIPKTLKYLFALNYKKNIILLL